MDECPANELIPKWFVVSGTTGIATVLVVLMFYLLIVCRFVFDFLSDPEIELIRKMVFFILGSSARMEKFESIQNLARLSRYAS